MSVFTQTNVPAYWFLVHQMMVTTIRQGRPSILACLVCGSPRPCTCALERDRLIPSLLSTHPSTQTSSCSCPSRKLLVWSKGPGLAYLAKATSCEWSNLPKISSNSNQTSRFCLADKQVLAEFEGKTKIDLCLSVSAQELIINAIRHYFHLFLRAITLKTI